MTYPITQKLAYGNEVIHLVDKLIFGPLQHSLASIVLDDGGELNRVPRFHINSIYIIITQFLNNSPWQSILYDSSSNYIYHS